MIQNVVTGDRYVGSSRNLKHRKAVHLHDMQNGNRGNYKMKRDCDKYGKDVFKWVILEFAEPEKLVEREQHWIDLAKPEYNIRQTAHNNCPTKTELTLIANKKRSEKMTGRKETDEHRKKISNGLLQYYSDPKNHKPVPKERRKHLSEINTGEKNPNWGTKRPQEFKDMIGNLFSSVQYTFVSPGGEEITFSNLLGKGEELTGLKYWQLRKLYQGKKKEYNGWTFKNKADLGYKKER